MCDGVRVLCTVIMITGLCDLVKTVVDLTDDSNGIPNNQIISPIVLLLSAVSVCVCMRMCMCTCVCLCICVYVCTHMCMRVCICVLVCIYVHAYMCVRVHVNIFKIKIFVNKNFSFKNPFCLNLIKCKVNKSNKNPVKH